MARYKRFTFLVDLDERQLIDRMAQRLQRKPADAVRFVALETARALESDVPLPSTSTAQPKQPQAVQP